MLFGMDDALLESLLWQAESATLDFKSHQYPFAGATNEQKGELLKDILAFANAWRQTDAHILIGVEEVRGGRSIIHGIPHENHLDDHSLQQFVCSKTNRPVPFSYAPFVTCGVEIGVLTISVPDQRPFFLNDRFGALEKHGVYVRRGSATVKADPDEIGRMSANTATVVGQPSLRLEFCDSATREVASPPIVVQPVLLHLPKDDELPVYGDGEMEVLGMRVPSLGTDNGDYYIEVGEYAKERFALSPISICVTNTSTVLANSVVVTFEAEATEDTDICCEGDLPSFPSTSKLGQMPRFGARMGDAVRVGRFGERWEIKIAMGNIQPGMTEFSPQPFYVTSKRRCVIAMRTTVSANNLRAPLTGAAEIRIAPYSRVATVADIVKYADKSK